jgi:hypothetical protein
MAPTPRAESVVAKTAAKPHKPMRAGISYPSEHSRRQTLGMGRHVALQGVQTRDSDQSNHARPSDLARADLLIAATLGELPFGPFTPTEDIVVTGSIVNVSNQDVTICEGICGDANSTYELGGSAFAQTGYTFSFGDRSDPSAGFLDGEASGTYTPGQEKSFIFGEYTPDGGSAPTGLYNFDTQLRYSPRRLTARWSAHPALVEPFRSSLRPSPRLGR